MSDRGGFVHLHTHTHNSGFDGFGRASDFAKVVKSLGQEAIAFTEHGTVRGIPEAQSACDEAGIKFIPGMEAYLCDDMDQRGLTKEERNQIKSGYDDHETAKAAVKEAESSRRDRDHITIWAQNQVGLTNLYRLSSEAWNRGFYYKPRLDLSCIEKHSEGLLISTGCPGGIIPKAMRNRTFDEALARMERLATHFRDRLYVEIMPHIIEEAPELQDQLLAIALEFETRVIATQDAHYPCRADAIPQETLLCVHTGETIEDVDRFSQKAFGKHDFWIKSRAQILDAFGRNVPSFDQKLVRSMCDATIDFADRCSARYDKGKPGQYLVAPTLPPGVSSYDEWMFDLCEQGWRERFGNDMIADSPAVYREQIVREFEVFRDKGFAPYMMMVWDVIRYCREVGIFVGPGRGSAAGSMVSYLLQITKLDPIVHGLSFDRFVSPNRESLPDIDVDLQHDRRWEVIRYLQDKYGEDHVTHISTAITMGGKRVLRDVGKVHGVPIAEVERVTSSIIDSLSEEDQADDTAGMALTGTEAGRKFAGTYPDAADAAQRLEGMYRDAGIHPAGIIVAPYPVRDLVPLESRRGEHGRVSVTAFDMRQVEAMGFVKADYLGLKTATSQAIMQALSGIDPDELGLDDQQTLGAFTDGRFGGIFQYDSPAARRLCKGYTFKHFSDIAVMTALNRPGPMQTGLSQAFLDRAGNPKLIPKMHPLYAQSTAETHGVLIYQEQILAMVVSLCGYSMAEADDFRGKVAKKKGVAGDREKFVNGAVANGMSVDEAQSLFESVIGFGSYAFSKNHAYCYGLIAYQMMHMKVHRSPAFFTSVLAVRDEPEIQVRLAAEARRMGIPVGPPDIQKSEGAFSLSRDARGFEEIVGSVADVKGVGAKTAEKISRLKPFSSLRDFYLRTKAAEGPGRITLTTFKALAETTALRSMCPNHKLVTVNAAKIWDALKKGYHVDLDPNSVPDYTQDEAIQTASVRYPLYVDVRGRGEYDAVYDEVVGKSTRPIVMLADVPITAPDSAFALGRVNAGKLFSDGNKGQKSARVSLLSPDGVEILARADSDVVEQFGAAHFTKKGEMVLAIIATRENRDHTVSHSIEALWPASELGYTGLLGAVAHPERTKPRDPIDSMVRCPEDATFRAKGMVIRVKRSTDKKGQNMLTVGLLGRDSYIRFFVFASRVKGSDVKYLAPGNMVDVTLKKLSGDACFLTDSKIRFEAAE